MLTLNSLYALWFAVGYQAAESSVNKARGEDTTEGSS